MTSDQIVSRPRILFCCERSMLEVRRIPLRCGVSRTVIHADMLKVIGLSSGDMDLHDAFEKHDTVIR